MARAGPLSHEGKERKKASKLSLRQCLGSMEEMAVRNWV
jgi:hypothetical protein